MKIHIASFISVSILCAYGLVLRLFDSGAQSLWIDEAFSLNAAKAVATHGYPLLDSGHIYTNNFVTVYITAAILKLSSFDAFHPDLVRVPAALFGAACIVAVYFLARRMFMDRRISVAASFLVAFSYHAIAWSRQVRGYEAAAVCIILVLWCTWSYVHDRRRSYLIGAIICLVLGCLSHWVVLTLIVPCALAWWLRRRPVAFLLVSIAVPVAIISLWVPLHFLIPRYVGFPLLALAAVLIAWAAVRCADALFQKQSLRWRTAVSYVLLIMVCWPLLTVRPQSFYELGLVSPQSDYNALYRLVQAERRPGDFLISIHPALTKLYLGEYGAWLPYSLYKKDEPDFYSGVPALNTLDELKAYTAGKHGFIIWPDINIDLDRNRLTYIVDNSRTKILIHGLTTRRSEPMWVYEF